MLKVNKLPEAMKLQHAENIFDGECIFYKTQIILETDSFIIVLVPVTGGSHKIDAAIFLLVLSACTTLLQF